MSLSTESVNALEAGYAHVSAQRDILIRALERIAAGDKNHNSFAVLAISEARDALERVSA